MTFQTVLFGWLQIFFPALLSALGMFTSMYGWAKKASGEMIAVVLPAVGVMAMTAMKAFKKASPTHIGGHH